MIIGIGGCSNSGKSMLAMGLAGYLGRLRSVVLNMDDFVFPKEQLPLIRNHVNWEVPETIDIERYIATVKKEAQQKKYVICEGIFAFYFPQLTELYDYKIFLELNEETFYERKARDLRWGKEPLWYIKHIRQSYLKYGRPSFDEIHLVLDAAQHPDIHFVAEEIKALNRAKG